MKVIFYLVLNEIYPIDNVYLYSLPKKDEIFPYVTLWYTRCFPFAQDTSYVQCFGVCDDKTNETNETKWNEMKRNETNETK